MIWLMLLPRQRPCGWRFVRAEAPCWKGELIVPLWRYSLVLGWQAQS